MVFGEGETPARNPGFETNDLSGWQWSASPGAHATGTIDLGVCRGGKQSFRITYGAAQAPNVFCILSQTLQVKPNTVYEFSIWSKGTGVGNAWVGGGPGWKLRNRFPAGTYDWQKTSGTFSVGPNETTFPLIIGVESTTQALWLDDLVVVPIVSLELREYRVVEKSLAPPEAVASFLRPCLPESAGICVFGFPLSPGEFEQFSALGLGLVRTNMHWADAEPQKGKFDEAYWKTMKGYVDSYAQNGTRMLFILAYGNPAYGGKWHEMPRTPELRAAFARFAAEAAEQFKERKVMFELWNEPDGAVTAEEYMALAKMTIPAMRKANPNVVVIGPGAHHYATDWLERCFKYGLLNLVDAVSIHLYLVRSTPELNTPVVRTAKKLVAKYAKGRTVSIVNSEWGYKRQVPDQQPNVNNHAVSTEEQAEYLARTFLLSQLWDLRFNTWFCWWLGPTSMERGYALVTPDRKPTPAYHAMRNLIQQLPKGQLKRQLDVGAEEDYVLEFDTTKGVRWTVWTIGEPHEISVPVGDVKRVRVTDLSGSRSITLYADQSGVIVLPANGAVQYLKSE